MVHLDSEIPQIGHGEYDGCNLQANIAEPGWYYVVKTRANTFTFDRIQIRESLGQWS